ncbi:hypothetical protein AAEU32_11780 [Pseudoalteromonas sp. SSDWG2]|uniref:hypothetical protein n=1 Tax=Pseudoalteromonas sp. SSDWG2 TaxID=3139391 RepID=UPI003BAB92EC
MNTLTKAMLVATTLTLSMNANATSLTDDIERAIKEAANEAFSALVSEQKAAVKKSTQEMFSQSAKQQKQPHSKKVTKGDGNDA